MNEREVTLIVHRYEVMIVFVDLHRRQLALVDYIPVAQRAQIEPIVKSNGVRCALSQNVQLALELFLIELSKIRDFW